MKTAAILVAAALSGAPSDIPQSEVEQFISEQCQGGCRIMPAADLRRIERLIGGLQQQVEILETQARQHRIERSARMICT